MVDAELEKTWSDELDGRGQHIEQSIQSSIQNHSFQIYSRGLSCSHDDDGRGYVLQSQKQLPVQI